MLLRRQHNLQNAVFSRKALDRIKPYMLNLRYRDAERFRNGSVHEFYSLKFDQLSKFRPCSHELTNEPGVIFNWEYTMSLREYMKLVNKKDILRSRLTTNALILFIFIFFNTCKMRNRNPHNYFFMVNMVSGMDCLRVRRTTTPRNTTVMIILQLIPSHVLMNFHVTVHWHLLKQGIL